MSETDKPRPIAKRIEQLKTVTAIVAGLAGAVTGLWGIYEKARSDAQSYTAASYETLAPQINEVSEALKQLQQDNQRLREILAQTPGARVASEAVAATEARSGRRVSDRPKARPPARPDATPAAPAVVQAPTTAALPPAAPTPAQPTESQPQAPAAEPADPLERLRQGVEATRESVERIRRVPEVFDKVLQQRAR